MHLNFFMSHVVKICYFK